MNATQNTKSSAKANAKDAAAKAHAAKAGTAKADDHKPAAKSTSRKPAAKKVDAAPPAAAAPQAEKRADVTRTTPKMEGEGKDPIHEIFEEQRAGDRRASDREKSDAAMKFSMQQLSAEQKAKPAVDMEAFKAELKALQEKFGVNANVQVKAPRATGVKQNGIARPGEGTVSGRIWATADKISFDTKTVAPIAVLRDHPNLADVNEATLKTQYARWRQFHDISGRLPRIVTLQQQQGQYDAALPHVAGSPKSE